MDDFSERASLSRWTYENKLILHSMTGFSSLEHLNSNNSPFKFNAKELDEETGNYYYGARYYDPKFSIWLSVDPLAELMPEWSSYAYTFNNPVNFTDPTGMAPETWVINGDTGERTYIDDDSDDIVIVSGEDYNATVDAGQEATGECTGDCDSDAMKTYQDYLNQGTRVAGWAFTPFADLIAENESKGDYNIANRTKGGLRVVKGENLVEMTIFEIMEKQKSRDLFAVGKYQLIPSTLIEAVSKLNLNKNAKFSEGIQDYIFSAYLINTKRPQIQSYLSNGGASVNAAMYTAAKEWASIGVEAGQKISGGRTANGGESYYAGDGLNKAHITPNQIKNALINSRR